MKNSADNLKERNRALVFVIVQFFLLILLVILPSGTLFNVDGIKSIGFLFEIIGVMGIIYSAYSIRTSLTVMPQPKNTAKLSTTGLYSYVRHPMYTCVIMIALGIALRSGAPYKFIIVVCLVLLFYFKSKFEDTLLLRKFPTYTQYTQGTPRFFPKIIRNK